MPQLYRSTLFVNVGDNPFRDRPGREWLLNPYRVHQRIMWALDGTIPKNDTRKGVSRKDCAGLPLFRIFAERAQREEGSLARPRIIVQTVVKPDWKRAFAADGHEAPFLIDLDDLVVEPYAPELKSGEVRAFQILANPTTRSSVEPPQGGYSAFKAAALVRGEPKPSLPKGKRRCIRDPSEMVNWFIRKAKKSGFEPARPPSSFRHYISGRSNEAAEHGFYLRETRTIHAGKRRGERTAASLSMWKPDGADKRHAITVNAALFEGFLRVTDPIAAMETIRVGIGPGKSFGCGLLLIGKSLGS